MFGGRWQGGWIGKALSGKVVPLPLSSMSLAPAIAADLGARAIVVEVEDFAGGKIVD
jgi:hypothetical protein